MADGHDVPEIDMDIDIPTVTIDLSHDSCHQISPFFSFSLFVVADGSLVALLCYALLRSLLLIIN